jgi:NAD(P)-dependent dehydrogenase (short-subunit alcohol dehydrogenase family)
MSATRKRFEGKVVLVTGGGTGIGKAIAEAFLAEGARVAVSGRRRGLLEEVHADGRQALPIEADVSNAEDRRRVIETVVQKLGGLDVLVNNAGVFLAKPLAEAGDEEMAKVFQVNVLGPLALTRDALPHLIRSKGNVINVSSVAATAVMPGTTAYSASKAALDHLTRILAAEVGAQGVRVNVLSPGLTDTDMAVPLLSDKATKQGMVAQTPLGRVGTPADMTGTALFLASQDAGWVTGQILQVSGGALL